MRLTRELIRIDPSGLGRPLRRPCLSSSRIRSVRNGTEACFAARMHASGKFLPDQL
jgi:hypothetical protein